MIGDIAKLPGRLPIANQQSKLYLNRKNRACITKEELVYHSAPKKLYRIFLCEEGGGGVEGLQPRPVLDLGHCCEELKYVCIVLNWGHVVSKKRSAF